MNFLALIGGLVIIGCIVLGLYWIINNVEVKSKDKQSNE